MTIFRRGRYVYWLARALLRKYTKSLGLGLTLGLIAAALIWRFIPVIGQLWLSPTTRIGMVGDFTPTTLPLEVQELVSSGLTKLAPDGSAGPGLATHWEATDSGKIYIFHLDPRKVWHSGQPVVAQDVNYNIRNVRFSVLDNHTLKAVLDESFSPFPTLVSKPIFISGLKGFGDYKVASLVLKGNRVDYIKLVPRNAQVFESREYRFYPTETQAILAYKQGDVDILEDMSDVTDLKKWGHIRITATTRYDRMVSLFLNSKDNSLSERSARQALSYGLPKFNFEKAYSPISKASWAYSEKIRHYDPNPQQAKRLLEEGPLASSASQLTITTFSQFVEAAQSIANAWTKMGVPTKVKVENVLPQSYQILLSAQTIPPDPDQYPYWHSTQHLTNITGYANVKIDKLLEDGRIKSNKDERTKIYYDFQRYLVEDSPVLFLYYPVSYTVHRI